MVFELNYDCWTVECPGSSCTDLSDQSTEADLDDARKQCFLSHFKEKYEIDIMANKDFSNNNTTPSADIVFTKPVVTTYLHKTDTYGNYSENIDETPLLWMRNWIKGEILSSVNPNRCQKETRCNFFVSGTSS